MHSYTNVKVTIRSLVTGEEHKTHHKDKTQRFEDIINKAEASTTGDNKKDVTSRD